MEDVVKELNALLRDRFEADIKIIWDYAKVLYDESLDNDISGEDFLS